MDEGKFAVLQMKYARIVELLADTVAGLSRAEAMRLLYNSQTMELMEKGIADLHCMSDQYLADEVAYEYGLL